jgi:hypothetical protein
MSVNAFIPEIWSAKIFSDFDHATVFGGLVNRDYEGEIRSFGDTVRINAVGPITVNSYTKNSTSDITVQDLTDAQTVLLIDKAKYFAFQVDDVDQAQTNPKVMGEAMRKAGLALAEDVDSAIADLYTDAGGIVTSTACGPTGITEVIGKIGEKLSQNDVPMTGRWMVVPPWFQKNLVQAEILKWVGMPAQSAPAGAAGAGYVGSALGFDFYMSNMLNETTASASTGYQHYVMAGTRDAITFASQISKVEAYRPEGKFADAVKGLNLYGLKVIQPKALVCATLVDSTV